MSQYQQSPQYGAGGTGQQRSAGTSRLEYPTASHLSADVRRATVDRLNPTLADLTVLQTQAKFAHWNVKGMAFYGLHDLFDDLAADLADHVDLVAERITALGGQAMGTAGQVVASCRLPPMPTDAVTGQDYVDVVAERLAVADAILYEDIQAVTGLEDVDTADLLNEISRDVSTYLWFVEAHRQTQPIGTRGAGYTQLARTSQQPPSGPPDSTAQGQAPQPTATGYGAAQQGSTGGQPNELVTPGPQ